MTLAKHWKYPQDEDLVLTALRGLVALNPNVRIILAEKIVFAPKNSREKVAVISGGGAGHEPLHSGFVGSNLLDAAVSGAIFASPSTKQIMAALKATADKQKGAVIVVKNYTGDILHFGLVAERAKRDGYSVELVTVSDDVAVGRTQNKMVGRRGLAGTALVHKIVGGASSSGADVAQVAQLGRSVNDSLVTMSASLDRTSVPGREGESELDEDATVVELGLGIHNEPGEKIPIPEITGLVDTLYQRLLDAADTERHYVDFSPDADYVLLVNNIGGTSSLELLAITHYAVERCPLTKKPVRVLVSDLVTSLNSPGFSLTLLNLDSAFTPDFSKSDVLAFLDMETDAPGWKPKAFRAEAWAQTNREIASPEKHAEVPKSNFEIDADTFKAALENALDAVIEKAPVITKYDTQVGDGDCGETLKNGAMAILKRLESDKKFQANLTDPVATLSVITDIVEDSMGGTSGGIYAIFLTSLVKHMKEPNGTASALIATALKNALYDGLFRYTKARQGDRTLVDTLQPFVDDFSTSCDLRRLVDAARRGCQNTAQLEAKFGRSSYISEADLKEDGGIPDPGAVGLLAIVEGFCAKY